MARRLTTLRLAIAAKKKELAQGEAKLNEFIELRNKGEYTPRGFAWWDTYVLKQRRELEALEKRLETRLARQG